MAPEQVTLAAFTFFSVLRLGSYLPQIACVARDRNGATSISFLTWGLWLLSNMATVAYALVNVGDTWLAAVHTVNAVCCLVVLVLAACKRRRLRRQRAAVPAAVSGS